MGKEKTNDRMGRVLSGTENNDAGTKKRRPMLPVRNAERHFTGAMISFSQVIRHRGNTNVTAGLSGIGFSELAPNRKQNLGSLKK